MNGTSSTTTPSLTLGQANQGGALTQAIESKDFSTKDLTSSNLNQLLAPNSSQNLDPKGLNTLSNLTWNLDPDQTRDLLKALGSFDPNSRAILLTQLGALSNSDFDNLLRLIGSLDRPGLQNLFTQLGNNNIDDFRDLLRLIRFFGLNDLSNQDLDDLFTIRRFFGLRDLRDRDLDDLFRLIRFFDLDDLRDLRFRIDRIRSGRASPSINISNTGDNVNLCLGIQQVVNTGNVANQQGVFQYNSGADDGFLFGDRGFLFGDRFRDRFGFFDDFDRRGDIDFEGSSIEINPDLVVECQQTIIQAVASGNPLAQAFVRGGAVPASAVAGSPVATVASGAGGAPSVGLPAARGAALAQLPRTGGMSLTLAVLGLAGAGAGLALWRHRR